MAIATGRRRRPRGRDQGSIPVWREPVRGADPDPRLWMLRGRDQLRAGFAGRFAMPPMSYLADLHYTAADDEWVEWEQPISPWFLTTQGVVPGGFLAVLADCALGAAISANLPPRTPFSTSELALDFLRAVPPDSGPLRARARQIHANQRLALSECLIENRAGELVVQATSRCVIGAQVPIDTADIPDDPAAIDAFIASIPIWTEQHYDTPHPFQRPVQGEVLDPRTWQQTPGREVLERQIGGELPMPPIHHLTGMRPTATGHGQATFALPASAWLTSGMGTVLGGFVAMLAYSALASAIQTTIDPSVGHVPIDLKVSFLRPVKADPEGGELVAHGMVAHCGRTLAVADAEVLSPEGRPVAVAMGTQMLLPGQPASSFV